MTSAVRVVVIDDDADVRLLVQMVLEQAGGEVVGDAATADAGVELVAQVRPDVVVLDWEMPGRTGVEAIPELRAAAPDASIVMFSSHPSSIGAAPVLEAGADAYVDKSEVTALERFVSVRGRRHRDALISECEHWRHVADAHAAAGRWEAARQYYELVEAVSAELSPAAAPASPSAV